MLGKKHGTWKDKLHIYWTEGKDEIKERINGKVLWISAGGMEQKDGQLFLERKVQTKGGWKDMWKG